MSHKSAVDVEVGTPEFGCPPDGLYAVIAEMMRSRHVPGLSLSVVSHDRLLYAAGFGTADIRTAAPATAETAYLWFSMSKILSATAAMVLVDSGALDLEAPAAEYVPCLDAADGRRPTVRQLLDHTAGLGNPMPLRWVHAADAAAPDPEALLRHLMGLRKAYRYPTGEAAHYSNVGYLALGQVISVAAGMPFEDYMRRSVLEPAGMRRTGYQYRSDVPAATGYVRASLPAVSLLRAFLPVGVAGERSGKYLALNRFYVNGPAYGGAIGDVLDAGRFLRMHLGDGEVDGHRLLAPGTAGRMRQPLRAGTPFAHGLGWFRQPGPGDTSRVEHFGAGAGFWNVMRLYPERDLGVVLMTNSTATYDFEPLMTLLVEASWTQ